MASLPRAKILLPVPWNPPILLAVSGTLSALCEQDSPVHELALLPYAHSLHEVSIQGVHCAAQFLPPHFEINVPHQLHHRRPYNHHHHLSLRCARETRPPRLPLGGVSSRDVELRLPVARPAPLRILPPTRGSEQQFQLRLSLGDAAYARDIAPTPHSPPRPPLAWRRCVANAGDVPGPFGPCLHCVTAPSASSPHSVRAAEARHSIHRDPWPKRLSTCSSEVATRLDIMSTGFSQVSLLPMLACDLRCSTDGNRPFAPYY
ncbi:hypothetical protein B0H13DRAFT_2665808 [Mycena leptocephala]|nr:hypothetical protein B0H13DRAFT_2665808 [Mycena leptocephala]